MTVGSPSGKNSSVPKIFLQHAKKFFSTIKIFSVPLLKTETETETEKETEAFYLVYILVPKKKGEVCYIWREYGMKIKPSRLNFKSSNINYKHINGTICSPNCSPSTQYRWASIMYQIFIPKNKCSSNRSPGLKNGEIQY